MAKSLSHLKPQIGANARYKQGYFKSTSGKYLSSKPCIYRSSYEFKFMLWCEAKPFVLSWSSEQLPIEYRCLTTGKARTYWVDFVVTIDKPEKWLVEIKPFKEVQQALQFGKIYSQLSTTELRLGYANAHKTAAKNWQKWRTAKQYASNTDSKFMVLTEKFLNK